MSVTTSLLQAVYGAVTLGGSTARQIDSWRAAYQDQHDYTHGYCEIEFVTTQAGGTDAAWKTELDIIRNEFRKPRQDLVITQNGQELVHRKHSDNSGLNTYPEILKDGDPADTGRSRHFRVRISYELPADNLSQNFRRLSVTSIQYSPERRRTVTLEGEYTANSTDGTTAADTQFFAQIAAAELTLLNVVDPAVQWERTLRGPVTYSETRKVCSFSDVYREVNFNQSGNAVDDASIIDPHMDITVEQLAPGDTLELPFAISSGAATGVASGFAGPNATVAGPSSTPGGTVSGPSIQRPILITIVYDAAIDFAQQVGALKQSLWDSTIRPWIASRASVYNPGGTLVLVDEMPAYEDYENHIHAEIQFVSYSTSIIEQRITYDDSRVSGRIFWAVTSADVDDYYDFPGPSVRQLTIIEDRREIRTDGGRSVADSLQASPFATAGALGDSWALVSRNPKVLSVTQGLSKLAASAITIAHIQIETVFRFRKRRRPSVANAGGVTGANVPIATG